MQRDGVFWGVGVSKAAELPMTQGRAKIQIGTTSVCPEGPRNSHPRRSHAEPTKA